MPEHYFLYEEETDWNFDVRKHGFLLFSILKSCVFHKKGVSSGGDENPITPYYQTKNILLL